MSRVVYGTRPLTAKKIAQTLQARARRELKNQQGSAGNYEDDMPRIDVSAVEPNSHYEGAYDFQISGWRGGALSWAVQVVVEKNRSTHIVRGAQARKMPAAMNDYLATLR
jgi:hypothetical protein